MAVQKLYLPRPLLVHCQQPLSCCLGRWLFSQEPLSSVEADQIEAEVLAGKWLRPANSRFMAGRWTQLTRCPSMASCLSHSQARVNDDQLNSIGKITWAGNVTSAG